MKRKLMNAWLTIAKLKNKKIVTKSMTVGAFYQRIRPHFNISSVRKSFSDINESIPFYRILF
jgi:hypothetical protein